MHLIVTEELIERALLRQHRERGSMSGLSAPEIRQQLDHPVIDIDGHMVEFFPALAGELVKEGVSLDGESMAAAHLGHLRPRRRLVRAHARGAGRAPGRPGVRGATVAWSRPSTAPPPCSPVCSHERLDELGIDVSVIYPSLGLIFLHLDDERDRRGACRALNRFNAGDVRRARRPAASPSPRSRCTRPRRRSTSSSYAVEHARLQGGRCWPGYVQRPVAAVADARSRARAVRACGSTCSASTARTTTTPCGSSAASSASRVSFHSAARSGWRSRTSISSYMYNHVGHARPRASTRWPSRCSWAASPAASPTCNFAFLEGGVGVGGRRSTPTSSGTGRSATAPPCDRLDPAHVDRELFAELLDQLRRQAGIDPASAPASLPPSRTPRLLDECAAVRHRARGGHPRPVRARRSSSAARPTTR